MQSLAQTAVRDFRWSLLLRGIAAIVFGILAIIWPGETIIVLVYLFGVYAIIDGILNIGASLRSRAMHGWWFMLIEGIVSVLAGIIAFVWPVLAAFVFLLVLAAWAIITGIVEIVEAFSHPEHFSHDWWLAIAGVVSIILGVLLAFRPIAGLLAVIWFIGIYAIVFGILFMLRFFQTRTLIHGLPDRAHSGLA
jgi:uncharacterized membrane protein HdeD (DUF308 family)